MGQAGRDSLTGGGGADTFTVSLGASGITVITVDTVVDWATSDSIDTTITGAASTYADYATTATTIGTASSYAESQVTSTAIAHVFLYNASAGVGFLVSDLDNNDVFETGVVLTGAGAAGAFSYADLI